MGINPTPTLEPPACMIGAIRIIGMTMEPTFANVGVGFIPILSAEPTAGAGVYNPVKEPNVGVGFIPILQWFKGNPFFPFGEVEAS